MEWDKLFGNLKIMNWIILLLLGTVSYGVMKGSFTTGVIIGGLIIIANFHVLQHTIRRGFPSNGILIAKKASIIAKYYLRLAVMGMLIYLLITQRLVHPVGLVIGLSIVVISIVSLGIIMIWKTPSGKAI